MSIQLHQEITQWKHELQQAYCSAVDHRISNRSDHVDTCYATWWIKAGSLRLDYDQQQFEVNSGEWVMVEPGLLRSQHFSEHAEILSVRFFFRWRGIAHLGQPGLPLVISSQQTPVFNRLSEELVEHWEYWRNVERNGHPLGIYLRMKSCFDLWLAHWYELRESLGRPLPRTLSDDPRLLHVLDELSSFKWTGPTPYSALQQRVKLSRSQIDRLFRAQFGMTPQRWREIQCQNQAEHLLTDSTDSIKEIAYQLGFVDASHFGKWFRKRSGTSPLHFRELGHGFHV